MVAVGVPGIDARARRITGTPQFYSNSDELNKRIDMTAHLLIQQSERAWHPLSFGGFNPKIMEFGITTTPEGLFSNSEDSPIVDWAFNLSRGEQTLLRGSYSMSTPEDFKTLWFGLSFPRGYYPINKLWFELASRRYPVISVRQIAQESLTPEREARMLLFPTAYFIDEEAFFEVFVDVIEDAESQIIMLGRTTYKGYNCLEQMRMRTRSTYIRPPVLRRTLPLPQTNSKTETEAKTRWEIE